MNTTAIHLVSGSIAVLLALPALAAESEKPSQVKVAAVQMLGYDKTDVPWPGFDPSEAVAQYIQRAAKDGAQLIVFPEYPASVIEYLTTLRPRLELHGCYFAHVEPWLDPEDIQDLWFFERPPDSDERLKQIFDAVPHRLMFAGHYRQYHGDGHRPDPTVAVVHLRKLTRGRNFRGGGAFFH